MARGHPANEPRCRTRAPSRPFLRARPRRFEARTVHPWPNPPGPLPPCYSLRRALAPADAPLAAAPATLRMDSAHRSPNPIAARELCTAPLPATVTTPLQVAGATIVQIGR